MKITSNQSTQTNISAAEAARTQLGEYDFLKLLTTELKHQDPMEPMDHKQMISQLAQFSALEASNKTNTQLKALRTAQLLNKEVVIKTDEDTTINGKVTNTNLKSNEVVVNGNSYSIDDVVDITDPDSETLVKLDKLTQSVNYFTALEAINTTASFKDLEGAYQIVGANFDGEQIELIDANGESYSLDSLKRIIRSEL